MRRAILAGVVLAIFVGPALAQFAGGGGGGGMGGGGYGGGSGGYGGSTGGYGGSTTGGYGSTTGGYGYGTTGSGLGSTSGSTTVSPGGLVGVGDSFVGPLAIQNGTIDLSNPSVVGVPGALTQLWTSLGIGNRLSSPEGVLSSPDTALDLIRLNGETLPTYLAQDAKGLTPEQLLDFANSWSLPTVGAPLRFSVLPPWDGEDYGTGGGRLKLLDCLTCQPAEPDGAVGYAISQKAENQVALPPSVVGLGLALNKKDKDKSYAELRLNACSAAIADLRKVETGFNGSRISDFDGTCLGGKDALEVSGIPSCLRLYRQYNAQCLTPIAKVLKPAVTDRVGGLAYRQNGEFTEIACTATLLSPWLVVTARHCLPTDATISLVFLPNPTLKSETGQSLPSSVDIAEQLSVAGGSPPVRDTNDPPLSQDVVLLRLHDAMLVGDDGLYVSQTADISTDLTLVGLQEFIMRQMILEAVHDKKALPTVKTLIDTGDWAKMLAVDDSPSCYVADTDAPEVDHFCQSYNGTSGAPLFTGKLTGKDDARPALIALQSRGNSNQFVTEADGPINTAVSFDTDTIAVLEAWHADLSGKLLTHQDSPRN